MNRLFAQLCEENFPRANDAVMHGLAEYYINRPATPLSSASKAEVYLDKVASSAFNNLIPGLVYHGIERCTPEEEYVVTTRSKNNRRTYDLAKSDIYLVKLKLSFNDVPLPDQYMYLPYVRTGGIIYLGGSMFHITPVLSDKVISPGRNSIFIRLLQYKLNFYRCPHSIIVNGEREAVLVVWSLIYNQNKENRKVPPTTKANTSLAHYLFAKYGFTETFRKYAGVIPIVGTSQDITPGNYPIDKWMIIESAHKHFKPTGYVGEFYAGTDIRLAIPKADWNPVTQSFISGFFYVVDHFPEQILATYVDNKQTWMLTLANILFSSHYTVGNLHSRISEHFVSLDSYVDNIAIEKLAEKGYRIENFYDLLALLTSRYNELTADNIHANSMYGKYLDVLYYVMLPITTAIFTTKFALMKQVSKSALPPSYNNIRDTFIRKLKPGPIFKLSSDNPVTETVSYSGDHLYFKLTSKITEQESGPAGRRGRSGRKVGGEDKYLNASMIVGGSILFLSKSNPTPTNRINCFVNIDPVTGTILPNEEFAELLNRTDELLSMK